MQVPSGASAACRSPLACAAIYWSPRGRLGLNEPQVIEQEAGIAEYDAKDRPFIWSLSGGEQRHASGLVDGYVADDIQALRACCNCSTRLALTAPGNTPGTSSAWPGWAPSAQLDAAAVRALYQGEAQ